jgi:hypothetical protein
MDETAKNILKTITWFDLFEYPLTAEEIFNWLTSNHELQVTGYKLQEINDSLEKLINEGKITQKDNFYFLPGREETIATRKERAIESERKLKRARKAAKFLGILPFIKAVVVCNVLGYKNAKTEDDIDFLIITAPGRIWTARFFATGFFKVLNLRPNKKIIKDKFCFSFYLAEDGLNLESIKLPDDPYLNWWFTGLIPLYAAEGIFEKFLEENKWVKNYLPNLSYSVIPSAAMGSLRFHRSLHSLGMTLKLLWQSFAAIWPDKFYKNIQLWIMPKQLKKMANKNPGVIISDQILKFHLVDRRADFAEKFNSLCQKLIN